MALINYGYDYCKLPDKELAELFHVAVNRSIILTILRLYLKIFGYPDFVAAYRYNTIRRLIDFRPSTKLLDVGCGKAIYATMFRGSQVEYFGVEPDPERSLLATNLLNKLNSSAHISIMDAENLHYQDNFFDYVLAIEVIEHIENDFWAIKEMSRVLRQGGYLILSTPNSELLETDYPMEIDEEGPFGHKRVGYDLENILEMLRLVNLKLVKHKRIFSIIPTKAIKILGRLHNKYDKLIPFFHPFAYVITCISQKINPNPEIFYNHVLICRKVR